MGIKNLKTLLLKNKSLLQTESENEKYHGVFVDTMSFYVSIAHCVDGMDELTELFLEYIGSWIKSGDRVTLFVDRGVINIKEPIRVKRREASRTTVKRKNEEIEKLRRDLDDVPSDHFMKEEIITEKQFRIRRLEFHVYLANSDNLRLSLEKCLSVLPKEASVIYCEGVDAEFKMCREALKAASLTGEWPLLISTDHDTLLFSSSDYLPKTIKTVTRTFRYLPCSKSKYLSKLTALVNGCDFFPGLYGTCLTEKSLSQMRLFDEFTLENILRSLVIKDYNKKTDKKVDSSAIVDFIDRYAELDEDIYRLQPLESVTIQEFIFSALLETWNEFERFSLLPSTSVLGNLIYFLEPRDSFDVERVDELYRLAVKDVKKSELIDGIRLVSEILGYNSIDPEEIVVGVSVTKGILLRFDGSFYFNGDSIIENGTKLVNIGF